LPSVSTAAIAPSKNAAVNIQRPPSEILKKFYFDTVNFNTDALKLAIAFAGAIICSPEAIMPPDRQPALMLKLSALDIPKPTELPSSSNAARILRLKV